MSDAAQAAAPVTENGVPPATQDEVVEEAPGHKVFAGNLAYATTDDGLKAFFAPVESEIITAQVIMRGTRSAGYGFVALKTAESAEKAVAELDKKELDGRQIIVEVAKAPEQKDKDRKEKKARRRPGRRGSKAVPGEVTDAEAAGETGAPGEEPTGEPSQTVLFVANLGFSIDDAGLAALFTDAGIKVNSARIVRRRWGKPRKSKGYGFVDVGDEEEQKKAIAALEGKEVAGRPVAVKIAVNTAEAEEELRGEKSEEAPAAEPESVVVAS